MEASEEVSELTKLNLFLGWFNSMKKTFLLIIFILQASAIATPKRESLFETEGVFKIFTAYYPANLEGYNYDGTFLPVEYGAVDNLQHHENDPGRTIGYDFGRFEMKMSAKYSYTFPILRKDHLLLKDNNIKLSPTLEFSPIHFQPGITFSFTPLSFFTLSVENVVGTGWNFLGFQGVGKNIKGKEAESIKSDPFGGFIYNLKLYGSFQFDSGALFPGKWNHLLISLTPILKYQHYTNSESGEPWQYKNDLGENFNGWKLDGTYFIGYKMPLTLELAGILLETEQNISVKERSPMKKSDGTKGWGSDFILMRLGAILKLKTSEKSAIVGLFQLLRSRDYSDKTVANRYFEYREYESYNISLDRILFVYEYYF